MEIALLGGTGSFGRALAVRFAASNDILVGSRDPEKVRAKAAAFSALAGKSMSGDTNLAVAQRCDVAVLTVPEALDSGFLEGLRGPLSGKLVISPIVPLDIKQDRFLHALHSGSAAEEVAIALPSSRIAAALHTLPAATLAEPERVVDFDVPVCADSKEVFDECAAIVASVRGLRPLYAGSLSSARDLEALTPLILNVAKLNHLKRLSIKFTS